MNQRNECIKEFCAENFTLVPQAALAGAKRIELCDNLAVGGTTPSYGVIKRTTAFAKEIQLAVMTMIRPRGGDFVYSHEEVEMMLEDIRVCKELGSTGVVYGCLTTAGWLDEAALELLVEASAGMEITFHMAFDELEKGKQFQAIDWLAEKGVQRILTHGGSAENSIEENFPHLKELIAYAEARIRILPGAGISFKNVENVLQTLGVGEAHGTRIVELM